MLFLFFYFILNNIEQKYINRHTDIQNRTNNIQHKKLFLFYLDKHEIVQDQVKKKTKNNTA